jgi:CheY-like chemotaxis protein
LQRYLNPFGGFYVGRRFYLFASNPLNSAEYSVGVIVPFVRDEPKEFGYSSRLKQRGRSFLIMAKNTRIFVVEDHLTTARALTMYLETQGYAVIHAANVASALKVAANNGKFDLLICDISLPDGSGWDLMKKLSAKSPVRGIAYSASGTAQDLARSEQVGFIRHLVKGCSTDDLANVISEALNTRPRSMSSRPSRARRIIKP